MGLIERKNKAGKVTFYTDDWQRGRRIRHSLGTNKRTAEKLYEDFKISLRAQKMGVVPRNFRLKDFETKYLAWAKVTLAKKTHQTSELAFKRLREAIHISRLDQITPELLEDARKQWIIKGYGKAAIGGHVRRLKAAMRVAEKWRYIHPQPWRFVESYNSPGKLIYYTVEQYSELVENTSGIWRTAILLMGRAGLRAGEVMNLEWDDIDFDKRTIHIHAKEFWKPKGWRPNKPKERYIDMPEDLESHLQAQPDKQGFVLGRKRPTDEQFYWYFVNLLKDAKLKGSPHCFRHTYAAHLVSNGVSLEAIGELLGHTDPKTTKIYAHLMPQARRDAVDKLPKLIKIDKKPVAVMVP